MTRHPAPLDAFQTELAIESFLIDLLDGLARELERRDLSRKEFAAMLGKSPAAVTQLLNAENPSVRRIAEAYAVLGLELRHSAHPYDRR